MKRYPNNARPRSVAHVLLLVALSSNTVRSALLDNSNLPPPAAVQVDFTRDIRPVLEANCLRCHGPEKPKSHFRLDNREAALKGGENGPDILPGNSAGSPLIRNVAGLVPDMEMPPIGKGEPLSTGQISLLRAWIDQGVAWNTGPASNIVAASISPAIGGTWVKGDSAKYREYYSQHEGLNGGLEEFDGFDQIDNDTRLRATGHALRDDYKIELSLDRNDLGFIHSGWEQFRKYYDDSGIYDPRLLPVAPSLNEDLHLDIGRVWFDAGLTLPDWPRFVLGYEYDYKQGDEASTQYGVVGRTRATARNIAPVENSIDEHVHIIKFDVDYELGGISFEDRFRGEFYSLRTSISNEAFQLIPQKLHEGTTSFQGANTFTLEKKFARWLFGSAGYVYSKLDADSSFLMELPSSFAQFGLPRIVLERESHVGNVNALVGPFAGLTLSAGGQAEWTRQSGFGDGTFDQELPPLPATSLIVPFNVASDYDQTVFKENAALRYSKIPFTSLFADATFEQRSIGQYDQFSATQDEFNKAIFFQHTDFSSKTSDLRAGFNTSPWRALSFSGHYRRYEIDSHYDSDPLIQPVATGYPTFILARDVLTDEVEAKINVRPGQWLKMFFSYQYRKSDYSVDTRPFFSFGNPIAPGGPLTAGADNSHTYSANLTITPFSRLYLSTTLSYLTSRLLTADGNSPAVVPYRGDAYSLLTDGTYVLNPANDLFVNYAFSESRYAQDNFAAGVPLGIEYHRHAVQIGIRHRFSKCASGRLQYRFDHYDEPSAGGAVDYNAHTILAVVNFQLR